MPLRVMGPLVKLSRRPKREISKYVAMRGERLQVPILQVPFAVCRLGEDEDLIEIASDADQENTLARLGNSILLGVQQMRCDAVAGFACAAKYLELLFEEPAFLKRLESLHILSDEERGLHDFQASRELKIKVRAMVSVRCPVATEGK